MELISQRNRPATEYTVVKLESELTNSDRETWRHYQVEVEAKKKKSQNWATTFPPQKNLTSNMKNKKKKKMKKNYFSGWMRG